MNLTHVNPALAAAELKLRALAAAQGWAYTFADDGELRTQADTVKILAYRTADYAKYAAAMHAAGKVPMDIYRWRPIAPYGSSYHNFGAAFDIAPVRGTFAEIGALAPAAGLRWGGSAAFRARGRTDPPHFELPISLLDAKAQWLALGNTPGTWALGSTVAAAGVAVAVAVLIGLANLKGLHA